MSFFEALGKRTERVKQRFTGATTYECASCDSRFATDHDTCPHCGGDEISVVE